MEAIESLKNEAETIRKEVREFILENDWSLKTASVFFKCSEGALSLFLNGKTIPHERTLYRFRKRMGKN